MKTVLNAEEFSKLLSVTSVDITLLKFIITEVSSPLVYEIEILEKENSKLLAECNNLHALIDDIQAAKPTQPTPQANLLYLPE